MKATEFVYWMQGFFELSDPKTLNEKQVDLIKRHLNMVFIHEIDQSYPQEQQDALNKAHNDNTQNTPQSQKPSFVNKKDLLLRC